MGIKKVRWRRKIGYTRTQSNKEVIRVGAGGKADTLIPNRVVRDSNGAVCTEPMKLEKEQRIRKY